MSLAGEGKSRTFGQHQIYAEEKDSFVARYFCDVFAKINSGVLSQIWKPEAARVASGISQHFRQSNFRNN